MRGLRVGAVRTYDPDRKLYWISVEGIGDRQCRRMLTGLDKPLPPGAACLVVPVVAHHWVVIGELDRPTRQPDRALPGSNDQEAAIEGRLAAALGQRDSALAPLYRPLDLQGMAEEPQFVGDASLENRTKDHIRRSRIKVYSFGDIMLWASALCYSIYHRATNTVYRRCRNEVFEAFGVVLQVITPTEGDNAGRTTRRLVVRHNAEAKTTIDKVRSEGQMLAADAVDGEGLLVGPIAARGERAIWGTHRVEEVDNDTGTYRTQQELGDGTRITTQVGALVAENSNHPVSGIQNPSTPSGVIRSDGDGVVERGAHYRFANGLEVTVDAARDELEVLNLATDEVHRVVMLQIV